MIMSFVVKSSKPLRMVIISAFGKKQETCKAALLRANSDGSINITLRTFWLLPVSRKKSA